MAKELRISKETLLKTSLEIIREKGIDGLNVREVASRLHCSVQPIYYQFGSFDGLKEEVYHQALLHCREYMLKMATGDHAYKKMGMNYIRFAKEEPQLFQLLFMSKTDLSPFQFMKADQSYVDIKKHAAKSTGLPPEEVDQYHLKMWMFTHGIACLCATKTCEFTEEDISNMLTEEYQALNLFEKEKSKS